MSVLGAYVLPHPPILIPDVGKSREQEIAHTAQACDQVAQEIARLKPDTVVIFSPHAVLYADYLSISSGPSAQGDLSKFGAEKVAIKKEYDADFIKVLTRESEQSGLPAGTAGKKDKNLDHGVLIPLYFLEQHYSDYKLVRISIAGLDALTHYRLGACIAETAKKLDRRTVIIASGDLSHRLQEDGPYGFASEGPEFDKHVTQALAQGDFLRLLTTDMSLADAAGECGLRSFFIMAGALDGLSVSPKLLSYEGPFGVGYAVCSYAPTGNDETRRFGVTLARMQEDMKAQARANEDEYVRLARLALETYLKTDSMPPRPKGLSHELTGRRAGAFTSIKKNGRLRGCIGTITPTCDCIADEIMQNVISAGLNDPRFSPVEPQELDDLIYSVDVLGKAEPISSDKELDPKRYGVIVSHGRRRGLLLPDLEGVNTVKEQIAIALQKAKIEPNETYQLERFEVVRHK